MSRIKILEYDFMDDPSEVDLGFYPNIRNMGFQIYRRVETKTKIYRQVF